MLCDACQRRQACIPRAIAQSDSKLLQQLDQLQHCDRHVLAPQFHPCRSKLTTHFDQFKYSVRQHTASVYHRFLVNSG